MLFGINEPSGGKKTFLKQLGRNSNFYYFLSWDQILDQVGSSKSEKLLSYVAWALDTKKDKN